MNRAIVQILRRIKYEYEYKYIYIYLYFKNSML